MARHPVRSRTRNSRTSTGRGTSASVAEAGRHRGREHRDSPRSARARRRRASMACRFVSGIAASDAGGNAPSNAGRSSQSPGSRSTVSRAAGSPSQSVCTLGSASSSPSSRRARSGRNAASAGASASPAAGVVDDAHALARGGQQTGHAGTIGLEFQRIDCSPIDAAQQHADRLQAAQGLQEQASLAHGEVAALDQRAGQFARQQDVAVPGGVVVAGRQQRERRRFARGARRNAMRPCPGTAR